MTLAQYVLLSLVFLSQLVLHSAQELEQTRGCPSFRCGNLGKVGFPFSNITNPECGLILMNCTRPEPKVQLPGQEAWRSVLSFNYLTRTIEIKLRVIPTQFLDSNTSCHLEPESNSGSQVSPSLLLKVIENRPFFKCKKHEPHHRSPPKFLLQFTNYTDCKHYDLYYHAPRLCLPSLPETLSNRCWVVLLPSTKLQSNQSCFADNLNLSWDGILRIKWELLPVCLDCRRNGGQCLTRPDGTFNCGNLKKGTDLNEFFSPFAFPALKSFEYNLYIAGLKVGRRRLLIAISAALSAVGGLFLILMLIYWWKRVQLSIHSKVLWKRERKTQRVVEDFLKNYGTLAPKRYTYHDIKKITRSFKDKVGQGGYGVVYKGKLVDGCLVAVKFLDKAKSNGEEFMNEVASISRTSHVNVVSLLGFCFDGSKRALIYEFVSKGSLEKFIYDQHQLKAQPRLEWRTLYQISIGVARGLEYLHRGCSTRILHLDIKPHNILLDKDFTPKISDFGLAKICSRDESIISMLDARGTAGYIAPEVFCRNIGGVSHKSDVYSYGMMVLEIVGRRRNIDVGVDRTSEIYFPHWIYKRLELDEDLGLHGVMSKEDEEITRKMLLVSLLCIQTSPIDRPTMTKVVEMLEGRLELLSTPPKPYLCSPARDPVCSSNI